MEKVIQMKTPTDPSARILVVEDIHETRDGIEKLLIADGYRVAVARDQQDAIENAQRHAPDLILVSLAGLPREVVRAATDIRDGADIAEHVPVVIFCIDGIADGDEIALGHNVHVTRPDNFNQLRDLLIRLLEHSSLAA